MVSGIFIFDFDRKMIEIMPILPINSSNFAQMGMGIDGVAPPPPKILQINQFKYYIDPYIHKYYNLDLIFSCSASSLLKLKQISTRKTN